jgi:hypothetical protein
LVCLKLSPPGSGGSAIIEEGYKVSPAYEYEIDLLCLKLSPPGSGGSAIIEEWYKVSPAYMGARAASRG